jgi:RNA polymerase primary sigma factor
MLRNYEIETIEQLPQPLMEEELVFEITEEDQKLMASDDLVGLYFRQASEIPLLTSEEEISFAKRIEAGQKASKKILAEGAHLSLKELQKLNAICLDAQQAREDFASANTRLVISIAKKYQHQGLPLLDLIQEGNVGLMRAVDKYDYTRGNRFSTYASRWVLQGITGALSRKSRTIHLPAHIVDRIRSLYKVQKNLRQKLGRKPTIQEIIDESDFTKKEIRTLRKANITAYPQSLEEPRGEDDDLEFGDFLADEDALSADDTVSLIILHFVMSQILTELTAIQANILRLNYGLNGEGEHSIEEIGQKIGISSADVTNEKKKAIRLLRSYRITSVIRDYLV